MVGYLCMLFLLSFYHSCVCHDDHDHKSHLETDHRAFLGRMKDEFDDLTMEEARRRLKLLIPHIDVNKDTYLSSEELEDWVQDKYESLFEDPEQDPVSLFRQSDTNFDNKVSWGEYLWRYCGIRENATDPITKDLEKQFAKYLVRNAFRWKHADIDADNYLDEHEYHMFLKPRHFERMMPVVAKEELQAADVDKDGFVSLEEYIESLHMPALRSLDEKDFHEKYDSDKDGKLNLEEVQVWKTPELYNKAKLEAKHLIDLADDDKDGKLSTPEIILHQMFFVGSKVTQSGAMLHDEF